MSSQDTFNQIMELLDSETNGNMSANITDLKEFNEKFSGGVKSAGSKARKKTSEWGKGLSARIKELREIKKLFSLYRKETIAESKSS